MADRIMKQGTDFLQVYKEEGMAAAGCHALFVSEKVLLLGEKERMAFFSGKDIVMVGFAGEAGGVLLAKEKQQELLERYAPSFLAQATEQVKDLRNVPEAAPAGKSDECGRLYLSEGGVCAGLWNMAEAVGVGLEVEWKKIPVKQETIEICNHLGLNPYELFSYGSCLIVTENGHRMAEQLQKQGISAAVIGVTNAENDRIVTNGEDRSFLVKRYRDAYLRAFPEMKKIKTPDTAKLVEALGQIGES